MERLVNKSNYCKMNRHFLYKAKRIDKKDWIIGYPTLISGCFHIISADEDNVAYPIIEDTICRCAVLNNETTCKNVIWENDLYSWVNFAYGKCLGVIRFGEYFQDGSGNEYPSNHCYGFYAEIIKVEPFPESGMSPEDYPDYLKTISILEMFEKNTDITLVGNILDNKPLY